jgi:hypothetical protein
MYTSAAQERLQYTALAKQVLPGRDTSYPGALVSGQAVSDAHSQAQVKTYPEFAAGLHAQYYDKVLSMK